MIDIYDVCDCYESIDDKGDVVAQYPKPLENLRMYGEGGFDLSIFNIKDGKDIVWKRVRAKRDELLKESDWTQIPECTINNKQAWASYRQQLRDVPQNFVNPCGVVWPTKPS